MKEQGEISRLSLGIKEENGKGVIFCYGQPEIHVAFHLLLTLYSIYDTIYYTVYNCQRTSWAVDGEGW